MIHPVKWTERKFTFGYEKGYVPFFIERLRAAAPRLEELFYGISEEKAARKPADGWSMKEHAGHLADLEHLHNGRIDDFVAWSDKLRPADMSNKETYDAGHNGQSIPHLLARFRSSRAEYIERLLSLDEKYFDRKALHPRLRQIITLTDLLFFIAEHDNHHLAKIAALARG